MSTSAGSTAEHVLVAGGTGFIGGIIARSLVASGRSVVVPSRSADRLADLRATCEGASGTLTTIEVSGDHLHALAAQQLVESGVRLGAVVAALGGWSKGAGLLELSAREWSSALRDHLTSHFEALQAYVPLLDGSADPAYITLNGAAATQPMVGSGAISVTGAAQHMLIAVVQAERAGQTVRFHELSLMAAVAGDDRNLDPASEIGPAEISQAIDALISNPDSAPFLTIGADGR